jgi:hypothetical protein
LKTTLCKHVDAHENPRAVRFLGALSECFRIVGILGLAGSASFLLAGQYNAPLSNPFTNKEGIDLKAYLALSGSAGILAYVSTMLGDHLEPRHWYVGLKDFMAQWQNYRAQCPPVMVKFFDFLSGTGEATHVPRYATLSYAESREIVWAILTTCSCFGRNLHLSRACNVYEILCCMQGKKPIRILSGREKAGVMLDLIEKCNLKAKK